MVHHIAEHTALALCAADAKAFFGSAQGERIIAHGEVGAGDGGLHQCDVGVIVEFAGQGLSQLRGGEIEFAQKL